MLHFLQQKVVFHSDFDDFPNKNSVIDQAKHLNKEKIAESRQGKLWEV
jgi:hypothetical protein